jgi:hypothetical protein
MPGGGAQAGGLPGRWPRLRGAQGGWYWRGETVGGAAARGGRGGGGTAGALDELCGAGPALPHPCCAGVAASLRFPAGAPQRAPTPLPWAVHGGPDLSKLPAVPRSPQRLVMPAVRAACLGTTSAAVRVAAFAAMGRLVPRLDAVEAEATLESMAQASIARQGATTSRMECWGGWAGMRVGQGFA